jgi:hypothetical protein
LGIECLVRGDHNQLPSPTNPEQTLKSRLMLATILSIVATAGYAETADDCFPACPPPAPVAVEALPVNDTPVTAPAACTDSMVNRVDALNNQVKPIREIVGYVRTPQGLVVKLVNDHIVRIPGWVGFALDPVGTIKHKAIDEVRLRAKSALGVNGSCTDANVQPDNLSIDAA